MCRLTSKYDKNVATGYKVVFHFRGMFFSVATGALYRIGDVVCPKRFYSISKTFSGHGFDNVAFNKDRPVSVCHKPEYYGNTAVFVHEQMAFRYFDRITPNRDFNMYPLNQAQVRNNPYISHATGIKKRYITGEFVILRMTISGVVHRGYVSCNGSIAHVLASRKILFMEILDNFKR